MIAPEYCQLMARYNRWMNERLYALLAELPDDERKRGAPAAPEGSSRPDRLLQAFFRFARGCALS